MTSRQDSDSKTVLAELMRENGFTEESRFYRQTLPEFLTSTDESGVYRISANDDPSEAVINIYADGHTRLAQQIGPGLAFVESRDNEWQASERTGVEVCLRDVLDQGGLVYPVASVITDRAWYFTLPCGGVEVRETS